jgi:hypothetical protein
MAKCGYCGSTIIMGGVQSGTQRFCNRTITLKDAWAKEVQKG